MSHEFKQQVTLFGPHGVCNVEVKMTFDIHPNKFSGGVTLIAQQQLKEAVQEIISKARKEK